MQQHIKIWKVLSTDVNDSELRKSHITKMQYIVLIETVLAVVFVAYTFIRYMGFLFAGKK